MKKYISRSTIVILYFLCISCHGQKNVNLTNEDPKSKTKQVDLLISPYGPKSITRTIKQDKNGIIWFATWEGIIKFDGTSFTNITNDVSLAGKGMLFGILEDTDENIWVGTLKGTVRYDGNNFRDI